VLLAAGDIGKCGGKPGQVGNLVRSQPGQFLALGDLAYPAGSVSDFANCYHPYLGSENSRTRPVVGNHEYDAGSSLPGYVSEFGSAKAKPNGKTYYSFNLGNWHVVVLDSNCTKVSGGCGTSSSQYQWLAADLAASSTPCLAASWHHTPWTSKPNSADPAPMRPMMQLLQQEGADIALTGHIHNYERFARMNANGQRDSNGFRNFLVGTGGATLHSTGSATTGSEARQASTYGILRLDLGQSGYTWKFLPIAGSSWTDTGSDSC